MAAASRSAPAGRSCCSTAPRAGSRGCAGWCSSAPCSRWSVCGGAAVAPARAAAGCPRSPRARDRRLPGRAGRLHRADDHDRAHRLDPVRRAELGVAASAARAACPAAPACAARGGRPAGCWLAGGADRRPTGGRIGGGRRRAPAVRRRPAPLWSRRSSRRRAATAGSRPTSGSQNAATLELATGGDPVMAIGGFNSEGGHLSLAQFSATWTPANPLLHRLERAAARGGAGAAAGAGGGGLRGGGPPRAAGGAPNGATGRRAKRVGDRRAGGPITGATGAGRGAGGFARCGTSRARRARHRSRWLQRQLDHELGQGALQERDDRRPDRLRPETGEMTHTESPDRIFTV